ncbi:hypothetical protein TVAG_091050 [Trichomonas vaginalis G3]|uniref:Right handed beta helix domain-containing protein n=1 Tax=Trichomonas vaginalis (strain ATCC PRA-98 / G3) TaxID=412133 RepID=A2F609_TRIV3|nr:pectin lyase-like family [Trichomonas vaginalis G3]EAX99638.1 hypothetical protein TVAG_091050 [Trichomonas vaginalis G3]KAI5522437.1 pectin lyase-like family [Trichomonas vaginalis G3]|eukprot:XP_001312568.1 hypothetical protein [Trichomonas vaginalis G3]
MKNVSLINLAIASIYHTSPQIQADNMKFQLSKSYFSHSFGPLLQSFQNSIIKLYQTTMKNFLTTPVRIDSEKSFSKTTYSSRIFLKQQNLVTIEQCTFLKCIDLQRSGGGLYVMTCNATIRKSIFKSCIAKATGAAEITDSDYINFTYNSIDNCHANRIGACFFDGKNMLSLVFCENSNFTNCNANTWIGGIRLQHNSGKIKNCIFGGNTATKYGAVFEFSSSPGFKSFYGCSIINNSALDNSAGINLFLMRFHGEIEECSFINNQNCSVLVESDSCALDITDSYFTEFKSKEIIVLYKSCQVEVYDCKFNVDVQKRKKQ